MMNIPKIFHRIWLGGQPVPDQFNEWWGSWRRNHPGWTLQTWSEDDVHTLAYAGFLLQYLPKCVSVSQQSNLLRYALLHEFGGIYVDTDFQCLKNIEELLHGVDIFAAWESAPGELPVSMAVGLVGSVPKHPLFSRLLKGTADLPLHQPRSAGPRYFTKVVNEFHLSEVRVFEQKLFYPYSFREMSRKDEEFPNAYAVHHWASMWYSGTSMNLLEEK